MFMKPDRDINMDKAHFLLCVCVRQVERGYVFFFFPLRVCVCFSHPLFSCCVRLTLALLGDL